MKWYKLTQEDCYHDWFVYTDDPYDEEARHSISLYKFKDCPLVRVSYDTLFHYHWKIQPLTKKELDMLQVYKLENL